MMFTFIFCFKNIVHSFISDKPFFVKITNKMQSCMIDLLLNAYLTERSKSVDLSRLTVPYITQSQNALLSLETIYLSIQQSLTTKMKKLFLIMIIMIHLK